MSIAQLNTDLLKLLSSDKSNQRTVNKRLDDLLRLYGLMNVEKWYNRSNNKNSLLHELVEKEMDDVIDHLVTDHKLNINIRRVSDGITPYQLAAELDNKNMCEFLKNLGAKDEKTEDVSKWRSEEDKEKALRIVWIDLEMTSIEDPQILECAVIITDKDLKELHRGNWVIHFDHSVLEGLGDWHQKTFADINEGGNGLFDDVLKSKLTREEVEDELLAMIKKYCPEKECPLAGSSIHIDKAVLKAEMPKVHDYLHYRIIDVTSFQLITRRWAPWMEAKMKRQLARDGQETVNHRAMDDILWSISFMKQFQLVLFKQNNKFSDVRNRRNEPPRQNHGRQRSASPSMAVQSFPVTRSNQPGDKIQLHGDERRLLERIELDRNFPVKTLKLSQKEQFIYDANPHLREVFMNKEKLKPNKRQFTTTDRLLQLIPGKYNFDNTESRKISTTEYWGQRKLLLTEIEFLTNHTASNRQNLVVYAGVASGLHIPFLCSLFPDHEFVLFDSKELSFQASSKIHIETEKFTDRVAEIFSNSPRNVLFICNVRTFILTSNVDKDMMVDMHNQEAWHKKMKPAASLLNFRPPRTPGKTSYFKGNLIIEPWTSHRATECRLVVERDAPIIEYDNVEFAAALHRFQNDKRIRFYDHDMDDFESEGLDHCYDCQAEIFILGEYLIRVQNVKNDTHLLKHVQKMSFDISRAIEDKSRRSQINVKRRLNVIPKGPNGVSSNV